MTLENWADSFSRNVSKELAFYDAYNHRRADLIYAAEDV